MRFYFICRLTLFCIAGGSFISWGVPSFAAGEQPADIVIHELKSSDGKTIVQLLGPPIVPLDGPETIKHIVFRDADGALRKTVDVQQDVYVFHYTLSSTGYLLVNEGTYRPYDMLVHDANLTLYCPFGHPMKQSDSLQWKGSMTSH